MDVLLQTGVGCHQINPFLAPPGKGPVL